MTGYVEYADVPAVYRRAGIFVSPTYAEGFSNTILEAMASGLPVVATNVGGNAELVSHGLTGELVPAANSEALAQSLLRLVGDPAAALAMGRAGRASAEARFSMKSMVSAYCNIYDRQLSSLT